MNIICFLLILLRMTPHLPLDNKCKIPLLKMKSKQDARLPPRYLPPLTLLKKRFYKKVASFLSRRKFWFCFKKNTEFRSQNSETLPFYTHSTTDFLRFLELKIFRKKCFFFKNPKSSRKKAFWKFFTILSALYGKISQKCAIL